MSTTTASWADLCATLAPAGKPDLRDTSTTQSAAGKKARTAFDIPAGTTSAVTLAVKPRQAAYRAGPGIVVTNAAASKADATRRKALRLSKI